MFWTKLTHIGLTLAWICSVNCASNGFNFDQHYHHDHDPHHWDHEQPPRPVRGDPFHGGPGDGPPPPPPRGQRPPPPPPPRGQRPPPPQRGDRPPPPLPRDDNLPVLYMEDHCRLHIRKYVLDDARVYVDDSMHVELTKEPALEHQFSCLVTFSARDPDYRLLLHFEQVDINYNPGTVDRFRIYDGADARKELTPARGLYGKYSKGHYEFSSGSIRDYRSTGPAMTLYFTGSPSEIFGGFELLLTVTKNPNGAGRCDPGYLKCEVNDYCISESLLCNGAQNCGEGDFSDFTDCGPGHHGGRGRHSHGMMEGPTDIGLMVGCALSIVILMVVVIWLGVICMKKKGMRRHYARQEDSSENSVPHDGSIVEPAQIHRVISPPVTFMEPPPLYSENDNSQHSISSGLGYSSGRFELPPPYSPLDERDTAGLIGNESGESNTPAVPSYSQSVARVHQQGTHENRAPTPPVRTSSIPQETSDNADLRCTNTNDTPGELRLLTGITRQLSKDEELSAIPGTPKILSEDDSALPNTNIIINDGVLSAPSLEASADTQTSGTQTSGADQNTGSTHCDTIDVSVA